MIPPTPDAAAPAAAPEDPTTAARPETPAQAASSHAARLAAMRSNSRLLWALVIIVGLYTCYFASSLILPLVMAAFFAMLLSPLINRAPLRWLPRGLAALMLVAALVASLGAVAVFVARPASDWARNVPFLLREAAPKIKGMIEPLRDARRASR